MARYCPPYKSMYQQSQEEIKRLKRQLKEAHDYADELEDKADMDEVETVTPRPDTQHIIVPCGSMSIEITVRM